MADPTQSGTAVPQGMFARLGQLAWQALPAIASAIGVAGFVTLVGGAIQWVRFYAAGLPADQAVRVMPESELVTIGAVSLVGFTIAGLLAVLLLYVLDSDGSASRATLRGLFGLAVLELLVTLCFVGLPLGWSLLLGALFVAAGYVAYRALAGFPDELKRRDERKAADDALRASWKQFHDAQDRYDDVWQQVALPNGDSEAERERKARESLPDAERGLLVALRQATAVLRRARREWSRALDRWLEAAPPGEKKWRGDVVAVLKSPPKSERQDGDATDPLPRPPTEAALEKAIKPRDKPVRKPKAPVVVVVLGTLAAVGLALWLGDEDVRLLAGVFVVVLVLTVANFGLARATTRFAWYGVGTLLSLVLFGAALNIGRTIRDPQVQPAALVRTSDDRAICGVYVTETDDRVYLGRVVEDEGEGESGADAGAGRMFWVPSKAVDAISVGPLQSIPDAEIRARLLTFEVLADRPQKAAAAAKPTSRTKVTKTTRRGRKKTVVTTTTDRFDVPAKEAAAGPEEPEVVEDLPGCAREDLSEDTVERLKPAARTTPFRQDP